MQSVGIKRSLAGNLSGQTETNPYVIKIWQLEAFSFGRAVVFDSDNTFYYLHAADSPLNSPRQTIKRIKDSYHPYIINLAGHLKVVISFPRDIGEGLSRERTVLYYINTKKLIQDSLIRSIA